MNWTGPPEFKAVTKSYVLYKSLEASKMDASRKMELFENI